MTDNVIPLHAARRRRFHILPAALASRLHRRPPSGEPEPDALLLLQARMAGVGDHAIEAALSFHREKAPELRMKQLAALAEAFEEYAREERDLDRETL